MYCVHHSSSLLQLHQSSLISQFCLESSKGAKPICLKPPLKTITQVCRPSTSGPIHLPNTIQNSPNTIPFSGSFFLYSLLYLHCWANFSISFQSKINYQITESFYSDIRKCSTLCSIHKMTMHWLDKFTEYFKKKNCAQQGIHSAIFWIKEIML